MINELLHLSGSNKTSVLLGDHISYLIQNTENRRLYFREVGSEEDKAISFVKKNSSKSFYGDYEFWYSKANDAESFICHINRHSVINVNMSHQDAIARGKIKGARVGQAVGNAEGITAPVTGYDISELGVALIPSPDIENGETMAFISTSPDDNPTGIGAREVTIKYIHPVTKTLETLILPTNGTTETEIPQDIAFNNDFYVSKNGIIDGEYSAAQGDITIYRQGTPLRVYSVIKENGNKSFTMSRLIPDDKDYFISGYTLSGNTKGVSVRLRATIGDDGVLTDGWLFKLPLTIGDTAIPIQLNPPIKISAGARLKVSVFGNTVPGVDVSVFINGTLEPKV